MEVLKSVLLFLWKVLLCLMLTPFFLFTWLKNILFLGLGLPVFYTIMSFAYYSFFSDLVTTDELVKATFTDTKITILVVVIVVMALLAAIYDYQDRFEDIMLL